MTSKKVTFDKVIVNVSDGDITLNFYDEDSLLNSYTCNFLTAGALAENLKNAKKLALHNSISCNEFHSPPIPI